MNNDSLKPQTKIIVRIFKDKNLDDTYKPEQVAKFISPHLKPWMKTSTAEYKGKEFCQVTIVEEYDPHAAFCDCLEPEFLLSGLEELGEVDIARCEHGYYDFFDIENIDEELHSSYILARSKYVLQGFTFHESVLKAMVESHGCINYEQLKPQKPFFVDWLVSYRNMSKEEAIKLVDKNIPELASVSSDHPEEEPLPWPLKQENPDKSERKKAILSKLLEDIFGRDEVIRMGFAELSHEDYDKLFNP